MLADKLRAAASAAKPIKYVGGYTLGFAGQTTNITVTLTSLTGGIASSPATNDLVIVYFATGSTVYRDLVVSGYTEVSTLYNSGQGKALNLVVAYKFMGGTPDTSFTLTGGTLSTDDGGAVVVHVFRNVNKTTPLDVTSTTAGGSGTGRPDPPLIEPITSGAFVVAGGASEDYFSTNAVFTSSDLTGFRSSVGADLYDVTIGAGYKESVSIFDPAQFGGGSTGSRDVWAAVTLALRPA